MRVARMREKLQVHGLVLLQHGQGFKVTDNGVKKPFEKDFPNLDAVKEWHRNVLCKNRLNEEEAAEWDIMYKEFVEAERNRDEHTKDRK